MPFPKPKYENSAGRLLALLESVPAGTAYWDMLGRLFDFDHINAQEPKKSRGTLLALVELDELYNEFWRDISETNISEETKETFRSGLTSLNTIFYPVQMNAAFRPASEAEKALLKVAATILPQEAPIEEKQLQRIHESIGKLRRLVEDAKLPKSLRKVILDLIRLTENAIARYNIHGARGLHDAYKAMLAESIDAFSTSKATGTADTDAEKSVWDDIKSHLSTINGIASELMKLKPMLDVLAPLLLSLQ